MKTRKATRKERAVITRKEAVRIFNIRESELGFFEKDAGIKNAPGRLGYTLAEFKRLSRRVRCFYGDPEGRKTAERCAC